MPVGGSEGQDDLDALQLRSTCPVAWSSMKGDARSRFCGLCRLNVFNLEGMTRQEALDLVSRTEGRLCLRFRRRADGTVLVQDCGPVRVGRLRRAAALSLVLGIALVGLAHGAIALGDRDLRRDPRSRTLAAAERLRWAGQWVAPQATFDLARSTPLYGYAPIAKAVDWADQVLYPAYYYMGLY